MKTTAILIFERDPAIAKNILEDLIKQGYSNITVSTNTIAMIKAISRGTFAFALLNIRESEDPKIVLQLVDLLERFDTPYILGDGKRELNLVLAGKVKPNGKQPIGNNEWDLSIFIKTNKVFEGIRHDEISHIKTDQGCIKIISERKEFTMTSSLNHFQGELANTSFLRVDKYLLVNLKLIKSFSQEGIIFRNGLKTPVSRAGFLKLKEHSPVIYTK